MPDQDGEKPWWAGRAAHWKLTLAATSIPFAVLATTLYLLRIYASHWIKRHRTRLDEVLMGLAVIFMWAETASVLLKCYNGVGTPAEELSDGQSIRLNLGSWLVAKFCVFSLLFSRLSIILFLKEIFGTHDLTRRLLWFLAGFNIVWALISLFMSIFSCKPVAYYWNKNIPGGSCIETTIYNNESVAMSVLGLVSDLAILATPLPSIWKLHIKAKQKVAVTAVLCVGVIVCIFSLLRCVQFAYFDTAHLSTSGNLETLWTLLETDLSITCGCMPHLRPLFSSVLGDSTNKSNTNSYHPSGSFGTYGPDSRHNKDSAVHTTIMSTSGYRARPNNSERRESDEVELKGIEVHTTLNYESRHHPGGAENDRDDSSANLSS